VTVVVADSSEEKDQRDRRPGGMVPMLSHSSQAEFAARVMGQAGEGSERVVQVHDEGMQLVFQPNDDDNDDDDNAEHKGMRLF
jgi:hypothetical protein